MNIRLNRAIALSLVIGIMLLILLSAATQTLAQEIDPTDDAGSMVIDMTPPALAQVDPPVPPDVDLSGLEDFLRSAEIIMGLLVFIIVSAGRIILPNTVLNTQQIYAGVIAIFAVLFVLAQLFGFIDVLSNGLTAGTIIANSVWAILAMLGVSSAAYLVIGKVLQNSLVTRPQGTHWLSLDNPGPPNLPSSMVYAAPTAHFEGRDKG